MRLLLLVAVPFVRFLSRTLVAHVAFFLLRSSSVMSRKPVIDINSPTMLAFFSSATWFPIVFPWGGGNAGVEWMQWMSLYVVKGPRVHCHTLPYYSSYSFCMVDHPGFRFEFFWIFSYSEFKKEEKKESRSCSWINLTASPRYNIMLADLFRILEHSWDSSKVENFGYAAGRGRRQYSRENKHRVRTSKNDVWKRIDHDNTIGTLVSNQSATDNKQAKGVQWHFIYDNNIAIRKEKT
jgi:hypothetical protein